MSNVSMEKTKPDKAQKVRELRKYHEPVFEALGVANAFYCPKMFYVPTGKNEKYVSFFPSELQRGVDVYTEKVDRDFDSEDATRTLYRWNYNMFWETEYEKTESTPQRILIPERSLEKLQQVIRSKDELPAAKTEETPLMSAEDSNIMGDLTIRDLAAILWKKPVSKKSWLNKLIKTQS